MQQLTGLDAAFLAMETPSVFGHVGSVCVLDPSTAPEPLTLDRLTHWSRPGLLAIGDAAHAMSPIGGVGINLAIQDAVAAANILAAPLARGEGVDGLLAKVERRRHFPTRVIQAGQKAAQTRIIGRVLAGGAPIDPPLFVRLLDRFPLLRRIPGRLIGLGIRRERVESPNAFG